MPRDGDRLTDNKKNEHDPYVYNAKKIKSKPTNKAVYTTTPIAGGWAGAVMPWAGAVMPKNADKSKV